MHDRSHAIQLVQNALLLEEPQRQELMDLLASPLASDAFVGEVINVLGGEQEAFVRVLSNMSDEEVSLLGMVVIQSQAERLHENAKDEADQSAGEAENLLSDSL